MSGLVLTTERRIELAELLKDEARLNAAFPHVADYLDTVMRLPGSGDREQDASFDLRMVHFLTGGATASGNPYWDVVAPVVSRDSEGRRGIHGHSGKARLAYAETVLQAAYAYAIPSPETLAWVGDFTAGRTLLELGAGRGYWAGQLADRGCRVRAFDSEPPNETVNPSFPVVSGQKAIWHQVEGLEAYATADKADAVLLLCWPPGWGDSMASDALAGFEQDGGTRLVFVGEPQGGKTGDDAFFARLAERWELVAEDADYVAWFRNCDVAQGWVLRQ
ncbi:hypothetical protein [Nocardia sp. NPDC058666]|uniref:hypothetical protein n=1 Tax=Nocardia sp. NPDC058666 TaxID=3346587 RepID=UPI00366320D9